MRQSELKDKLLQVYGEDVYSLLIENSDGISGFSKIKKTYSYNDLGDINKNLTSQSSFNLRKEIEDTLGEIIILKTIGQLSSFLLSLAANIDRCLNEKEKMSNKLFEENEDMIIQTLLLKSKSKTELKQLKVEGNEVVFSQVKDIAKIKWGKAYTQNLNDSIATNYSVFEYNILTGPVITTLKLL